MEVFKISENSLIYFVDDIPFIGNFELGSVIAFNEEGYNFLKRILKKDTISFDEFTQEEKNWFSTLLECEILKSLNSSSTLITNNEIDAIYLHFTNNCNIYCKGCYSFNKYRNKEDFDLSVDVFVDSIKQLKNYGLKKVIISGGEPTLRDDLEVLLREIKNISIEYVCLITNGIYFPEKLINVVKECVNEVSVSIDGYNENISYIRPAWIYNRVIDTIRVLKENEINVSMIVTLHRQNVGVMNEYKLLSEKLGVPFSYSILVCNNNNRDECKEFEFDDNSLYKIKWDQDIENTKIENFEFETRLSCEAGKRLLSIAANGDVYPCHMLHDEFFKFGNIKDMAIPEILMSASRLLFKFITVDFIKECNACKFRYLCGGGCRANAFYKNSDVLSKDPYCSMYYNFYNTILSLLRQQNLEHANTSKEELNEEQAT